MKKRASINFIIIAVAFAVLSLVNSCASMSSSRKDTPEKKEDEIVWPLPPDEPRLKYLKTISVEGDVKKKVEKTFWHIVFEIITGFVFGGGEGEVRIMRPYGIAEYDDILYVADQQLAVVHLFDFKTNDYFQIGRSQTGLFSSPVCIAVDNNGNLYVADSVQRRVSVYNAERINILEIGGRGVFERPTGLAINNKEGLLYVVDTIANKIKVFDLLGNFLFEFGKRGNEKGDELNFPTNIFIDKKGNVYVCDSMNFKIKIFDKDGKFISMFGKLGDKLGYFARPKGVAVDSDGNVYVVESLYDRVQIFDNKGRLLLVFGRSGRNKGEFWLPSGMYVDSKDRVYVADAYNSRVQIFQYLKSN